MPDTAYYYLSHLLNESEYDMITCEARNDPDFKNLQKDEKWWKLVGQAVNMKNDQKLRKISAVASCISDQDQLKSAILNGRFSFEGSVIFILLAIIVY
jgi:hypothetical protein